MDSDIVERINRSIERSQEEAEKLRKSMQDGLTLMAGCMAGGEVIKKCSCGKEYTLITWLQLPYAGFQPFVDRGGEMRHCGCGSTLLYVTYSKEAKHSYLPDSIVEFFSKK